MTAEREGGKSILRGTESQVFRGRAAGKRMKTRSSGNKANENPCLVDFLTSKGIVNLPQSVFPDRCYSEEGNNSRTRGRMR